MISQTNQEMAQILNACGPLCVVNSDGELMTVNEAFSEFFHLTGELVGRKVRDVIPELECQALTPVDDDSMSQDDEITINRTGRDPVVCSVRTAPYKDPDTQAFVGRVVHITDMTERRKADHDQAELVEKIHSINQELTDFAYIISHDLKAPLRGIKTIADWITTDYGDRLDDDGKEQLNLLINRVDRMHNLIEGVLQYSRIGRVREAFTSVDVNALIHEIGDLLACPDTIRITVQPNLPVVTAEPVRLQQIFQNLIGNAVKYMDKSEGMIHVACEDEEDFWRFSVSDNGPGIESEHFEKIFRIFQTLVPRDEVESTGVGLTLVKKMVELYGGRIWVQSDVGKGTTFYFTYPKDIHTDSA